MAIRSRASSANGSNGSETKSKKNGHGVGATAFARAPAITEQQKRESMDRLIGFRNDLAAKVAEQRLVNGKYRAALKETAKLLGEEVRDIVWLLEAMDRDVEDIDRETRARNRLAKFQGLALGSQLGLFEDGESVATKVETPDAMALDNDDEALAKAYSDGHFAGESNRPEGNPYPAQSRRASEWDRGFEARVTRTAEEMRPEVHA